MEKKRKSERSEERVVKREGEWREGGCNNTIFTVIELQVSQEAIVLNDVKSKTENRELYFFNLIFFKCVFRSRSFYVIL
jgi:hypothetical protein